MNAKRASLVLGALTSVGAGCADYSLDGELPFEGGSATSKLGKLQSALTDPSLRCQDRYLDFDGGVDIFRECGPSGDQRCYIEATWIDERRAYSFGRQKCYSHLPSPQPVECYDVPDRCDGNRAQTCNDHGRWVTRETCPSRCVGAGECRTVTPSGSGCTWRSQTGNGGQGWSVHVYVAVGECQHSYKEVYTYTNPRRTETKYR